MVIINAINIMFAADENYGDQLLIAIKSVLTHISPKTTINFFILDNELTPQTKHAVSKRIPRPNQVEFIALNKQLFENCPESNHINKTAYYRILAPTLLLRKKNRTCLIFRCRYSRTNRSHAAIQYAFGHKYRGCRD